MMALISLDMGEIMPNCQARHAVQVYGVVGNPVAHSRSPALHNAALASAGIDAVYIPYLVDDLQSFLKSFEQSDFRGFSVTLPHKVCTCNNKI